MSNRLDRTRGRPCGLSHLFQRRRGRGRQWAPATGNDDDRNRHRGSACGEA